MVPEPSMMARETTTTTTAMMCENSGDNSGRTIEELLGDVTKRETVAVDGGGGGGGMSSRLSSIKPERVARVRRTVRDPRPDEFENPLNVYTCKLPNGLYNSSSTSNLSNIKFTNGLKRPKSNESINNDIKKRIKRIKNEFDEQYKINRWIITSHKEEKKEIKCIQENKIDCNNISQLKKSSLENLVDLKITHEVKYDLIIKNHNTISESKEFNGDKKFIVSNDIHDTHKDTHEDTLKDNCEDTHKDKYEYTHEDHCEMVNFVNNLVSIVYYFCNNDHKDIFSSKTNNSSEISYNSESNSSKLNNSTNVLQIKIKNKETIMTNDDHIHNDNEVTCDNSQLIRSSSSENLVIVENSNNSSHLTEQMHYAVNDSFQTKNNLNKSNTEELEVKNVDVNTNKNIDTQNITENTNNIQMRSSDYDNSDNDIQNSQSTSDLSKSPNENTMTDILKCVKEIGENSFSELQTILNKKDLTFIKFEKFCSQMVFDLMKDRYDLYKQPESLKVFNENERRLRDKYKSLINQLAYLQCVIKKHEIDLKDDKSAQPQNVSRTVGLQATFKLNKGRKLQHPNEGQNLSIIEIDDDDDDDDNNFNNDNDSTELSTLTSENSDLPLCTENIKKKDDILPAPNISQNPSVIEIIDDDDDDELEFQTLNSEICTISSCREITQKKDDIVPASNILQNSSVIEIDDDDDDDDDDGDDEPDHITLNSDNSVLPLCSKNNQKMESKEQSPTFTTQEYVDLISDDDNITDLDKKKFDEQSCIKATEKKEDNIKLSNIVIEPTVYITSDDDDVIVIDTKTSVNQSCSKITEKKNTNKSLSPNPSKLTQNNVSPATSIEQNTIKINPLNISKNGNLSKLNLRYSPSLQAVSQPTANKTLTLLSTQQKFRPLISKKVTCIVSNLPNLRTSCQVNRTSSKLTSVNGMNKKFPIKNITVRPFFFKAGKFIPIKITGSGLLKTSTTTTNAHQWLTNPNLRTLAPKLLIHPAPLPVILNQKSLPSWKNLPSEPKVQIIKTYELDKTTVLMISWEMSITKTDADIKCYQIFIYHEDPNETPKTDLWEQVGEVDALPLPMACSLSEFELGEKYHIVVRAVDVHNRMGPFSFPQTLIIH